MADRLTESLDRHALVDVLTQHRMFRHVKKGDLEQLATIAKQRTYAPRLAVFSAGESGSAVYVVLSGWIKISRLGPSGKDIVLEVAGTGAVFGEIAVICGQTRTADATALTGCRVVSIDGRAVVTSLKDNPNALMELARILSERLARTTTQMEDTLFLPTEARLARALVRLATLNPQPSADLLRIDLGLSQRDLGDITGLSRETTNKQLSQWRDAGLVSLDGRIVTLRDFAAINQIAEAAYF